MPKKNAVNIQDGRQRVVIERVTPQIDCGRYPIKRVIGEPVVVEADIFADGHDVLSAVLKFRPDENSGWAEVPMTPLVNDRWTASFVVTELGTWCYTIEGWVDPFKSWRKDLHKRFSAGMDVSVELAVGAQLLRGLAAHALGAGDASELIEAAAKLVTPVAAETRVAVALSTRIEELATRYADRPHAFVYSSELRVTVDPVLARYGAWYELFPRSCADEPGRHGTFKDVERLLPRIADMGFQVLYLPPIHPIGRAFRKGPNNTASSSPSDPGSPWAIGSEEGGHKSIHSELGTIGDFRHLVARAGEVGLLIALDIAFQCSPDHPYVREHPEWFRHRPDGSIQYAENPPKKYQDIYPLNFETENWRGLWLELKSVFEYWIDAGVLIFRVDNPHTKTFAFWEWCIAELKRAHPEVILLSEAFTRPKLMYNLAKLGFTQSYNYFPWRNHRQDLTEYFEELTRTEVKEYLRPNLWPNTPDILTEYLQTGGPNAFRVRFILAATLGASYGIYGPAFELCENTPREPGSEEYLHSEKYEVKVWNRDAPGNLGALMARVNRIRKDHPALQTNEGLSFHPAENDRILAYSKHTPDFSDIILVAVNLDPRTTQHGWVHVPLETWGLRPGEAYQVHDLLSDTRYLWNGPAGYVELRPHETAAHIFKIRRFDPARNDFT
jgi:starch synthase (maltosyl-transferring)